MIPRDPDGLPTSNVREPEIAERKQTQQALEEAHQRFTTILDAMDAKVYLADMDTHEPKKSSYTLPHVTQAAEISAQGGPHEQPDRSPAG